MKSALMSLAGFTLLSLFENHFPLRSRKEPIGRHIAANLCVALGAAVVIRFIEMPVSRRLAAYTERRRIGISWMLPFKEPGRTIAAVVLMDYTMYLWHVGAHRMPMLWRFHRVHHVDRDLDAFTALRFHGGEILLSVPWRAVQIFVSGASPRALRLWQALFFAEVVFHHSNLRLPLTLERVLNAIVVKPRMHGIHHADVDALQHSNFSSGLTLWDLLHGTLRLGVPQDAITIGVP